MEIEGAAISNKHFSYGDDVLLLREALRIEPWSSDRVMDAWDRVAKTLSENPSFPSGKDGRSMRSRFTTLIRKHQDQGTTARMRKTGREEDFEERERLLEEVCIMMGDFEQQRAAGTAKRQRGRPAKYITPNNVNGESSSEFGDAVDGNHKRHKSEAGTLEMIVDLQRQQLSLQRDQLALQREQIERQLQLQEQQLKVIADLVEKLANK